MKPHKLPKSSNFSITFCHYFQNRETQSDQLQRSNILAEKDFKSVIKTYFDRVQLLPDLLGLRDEITEFLLDAGDVRLDLLGLHLLLGLRLPQLLDLAAVLVDAVAQVLQLERALLHVLLHLYS